jgi:hypothetical protein
MLNAGTVKIFITFDIDGALRNGLLRHLHDFEAEHPGFGFWWFEQTTPAVSIDDALREPALSVAQISERQSGPPASPSERAIAAVMANPDRSARAIAKEIGVSHQTVGRARKTLKGKPAANWSIRPVDGPGGPAQRSSRRSRR